MESPENERRWVEEYLRSQSGPDFEIEHVEKLASEYVMGRQHDVWDAHTSEGRWWVITNPTNLYSQDAIKSMDVALSFHIGLMTRMLASQPTARRQEMDWALDVLRRIDGAYESLDRAREVEDFQAVGMRLREALLSLAWGFAALGVADGVSSRPKAADFRGWAELAAGTLARGSEREELRGLLKTTSDRGWTYVNWLTHARRATERDARLACGITGHVVEAFITVAERWQFGEPDRCLSCGSYRLVLDYIDGEWLRTCSACGRGEPSSHANTIPEPQEDTDELAEPPVGDCVVIEDFGIYLTPQQAAAAAESAREHFEARIGAWTNPFAFTDEEDRLLDAHRAAFSTVRGDPTPGNELVYSCGSDACVNPDHAVELPLPDISGWRAGIVEQAILREDCLKLVLTFNGSPMTNLFAERAILDLYGVGDISGLLERVVLLSPPDESGRVRVLPSARRLDYSKATAFSGWIDTETGDAAIRFEEREDPAAPPPRSTDE